MQFSWLIRGLRTGVVTTRYPREPEALPAGFRGLPVLDPACCRAADGCEDCVQACLPRAITLTEHQNGRSSTRFNLNYGACVMCGLCVAACPSAAMSMTAEYELAVRQPDDLTFTTILTRGGANGGSTDSRDSN
jgi:formate hydrogenlyase subunit 6